MDPTAYTEPGASRDDSPLLRPCPPHPEAPTADQLIASSVDAIITKNFNGIVTSWNRGAERLIGYFPEEVIGRPSTMFIPHDRHYEERDVLRRNAEGFSLSHLETVRRHQDGSLILVSATMSPIRDASGKRVGQLEVCRDITRTKRRDLDNAENYIQLHQLLSRTPALVYRMYISRTGHCSMPYASDAVQRLFSVTPEQVRDDCSAIFHRILPLDRIPFCKTLHERARDRRLHWYEFRVKHDHGVIFLVRGEAMPIEVANSGIIFHGVMMEMRCNHPL